MKIRHTLPLLIFSLTIVSIVPNASAAGKRLSKSAAQAQARQIVEERKARLREALTEEWNKHEWTNGEYRMKFWDTVYGPKEVPEGGRSLYISLHGGGGAPPRVNDGQWANQKVLYRPAEGLYFVPRSPTDTWNMWHQEYMDDFLRKTIAAAVVFEGVNPDKVYILGYSAGGDGLYQLAPRMADHWAAASMMAGHPGDAHPESLRNLPFAIFMGGQDAAYDRNSLARQYSTTLDRLALAEGEGSYIHDTHIYEDCGHWMLRRDTIALPWMAQFTRNLYPKRVIWVQDDVLRDNFYWIGVPEAHRRAEAKIVAEIDGQTLRIEESDSPVVLVGLNDELLDLDKPVRVEFQGETIAKKRFRRTASALEQPLNKSAFSLDAPYPVLLKIEKNANAKGGATVVQL